MKKKLVILLSAVMIMVSTVPVMARDPLYSPTGTPATETPKKPNPPSKSPKDNDDREVSLIGRLFLCAGY